jgi:LuxR family transcriptional regulator, maltose regulon positive regulatory protein
MSSRGLGLAVQDDARRSMRFAQAKFRPQAVPVTVVTRSALQDRLTAGAGQRLTIVTGTAGTGKSVLLSSWAAARPPETTAWLSCDPADADPVRFWTAFIEAFQPMAPGFGADAAGLLRGGAARLADVATSIARDARKLPAGSAVVVDDFHYVTVTRDLADLARCWPARTAQLVLSSRIDPPLRLHRLRMTGELCELRDSDLALSRDESRDLLANLRVRVGPAELAMLHQCTEGWAAALQMVALSLRGTRDTALAARALDIHSYPIAEYFISEVLDQQPPEVARFMLDTSALEELTVHACAAVTGRHDAAVLLHGIDAASLFLVALDKERTTFRYQPLVHQALRAKLRTGGPAQAV